MVSKPNAAVAIAFVANLILKKLCKLDEEYRGVNHFVHLTHLFNVVFSLKKIKFGNKDLWYQSIACKVGYRQCQFGSCVLLQKKRYKVMIDDVSSKYVSTIGQKLDMHH